MGVIAVRECVALVLRVEFVSMHLVGFVMVHVGLFVLCV